MGREMGVEGLQRTITDVFVNLRELNGNQAGMRLTAERPMQILAGGSTHLRAILALALSIYIRF